MTTSNLVKSKVSTSFSSLFKKDVLGVEILEEYEKFEREKAPSKEGWAESLMAEQKVLDYLQQKGWKINNRSEVESFLKEHPTLIRILKEAPDEVSNYFEQSNISLEVFQSYEDNNYKELFLDVTTDCRIDEAFDRLEKLEDNWLIPISGKEASHLNLDLKFN